MTMTLKEEVAQNRYPKAMQDHRERVEKRLREWEDTDFAPMQTPSQCRETRAHAEMIEGLLDFDYKLYHLTLVDFGLNSAVGVIVGIVEKRSALGETEDEGFLLAMEMFGDYLVNHGNKTFAVYVAEFLAEYDQEKAA